MKHASARPSDVLPLQTIEGLKILFTVRIAQPKLLVMVSSEEAVVVDTWCYVTVVDVHVTSTAAVHRSPEV